MRNSFHVVRSTLERLSARLCAVAAAGATVDMQHILTAASTDVMGILLCGVSLGAIDDTDPGFTARQHLQSSACPVNLRGSPAASFLSDGD